MKSRSAGPAAAWKLVALSIAVSGLLACGRGKSALGACEDLLEDQRYEAVVASCGTLFEEEGDPKAGAAAARAHYALGQGEDVFAWLERLEGSEEEGTAWGLVARVHHQRGETAEALEAFEKALEFQRAADDHAEAAKSLYGLFYISWDEGRHRPALTFAHAAAEEAARAGDTDLEVTALSGVFTIHYELGDLEGAERAADAAAEIASAADRAYVHSFLGTLRLDQDRPALARDALEKALEAATGEEDRRFFRSTHLNLVRAHLELGELEGAQHHLAEAWKHAEPEDEEQHALLSFQARIEDHRGRYEEAVRTLRRALGQEPHDDWRWELLEQLGRAEEARGDLAAAHAAFAEAADLVESLRNELGFDELKPWLLEKRRRPFEALFLLDAEAGQPLSALAAAERAKARTFLDALIDASPGSSAPESAAERMDSLRELGPPLRESMVSDPRPIEEVLEAAEGQHVLAYFRARNTLWQITVAAPSVTLQELETPLEEIERLVSGFAADPNDAQTAADLARILLPPGSLPERGTPLVIVSERPLDRVPFAALRAEGRFLIEDHEITYAPSLTALATSSLSKRQAAAEPIVIGDPRGDLEAARREAQEVAARLNIQATTGMEASLGALEAAANARILHLATHGGLGPGGPWLVFADGELEASGVLNRGLAPELVVLASCTGASRPGLGMWSSLGAAFLAAGSEYVVAALGSIEDEAARRFVLRFYEAGGAGDAPHALARAQRAAITAGEAPATWAPFVVLGTGHRPDFRARSL